MSKKVSKFRWTKAVACVLSIVMVSMPAWSDIGVLATNNPYTGVSVKCDGTTDDAAALNTLFSDLAALAAGITGTDFKNRSYVTFPANSTCKVNSTITIQGDEVGVDMSGGTTWDFSGMPTAGPTATATMHPGDFSGLFFQTANQNQSAIPGTITVTTDALTATDSAPVGIPVSGLTGTGYVATSGPWTGSFVVPYSGYGQAQMAATPMSSPVMTYTTFYPAVHVLTGSNAYGANQSKMNFHLLGPGRETGTVGLYIEGNHLDINSPQIHEFGADVGTFNQAYAINMNNPTFYDAAMAMNLNTGNNAGEEFTINGGRIFNSDHLIFNEGELILNGTALDFATGTYVDDDGGIIKGYGDHIEGNSIGQQLLEFHGCNAFSHMIFRDPQIQVDNSANGNEALLQADGYGYKGCAGNGNGGYVKIYNPFINGINASNLSCLGGSNALDCVTGSSLSISSARPLVSLCDVGMGSGGGQPNLGYNVGWCP